MSEQEANLTSKEVFMQAIEEGLPEDTIEAPAEEATGLTLDHQPTNDDSDEYWQSFAESKGWKDSEEIDKADFKGYKAFIRDYDRIQENIESKGDLKEIKKQMTEVIKSNAEVARDIEQRHLREMETLKASLEAKKDKARDEGDFDAYDAANKELNEVEATAAPKLDQTERQEHDLVTSFRSSNPEILATAEGYDAELNAKVEERFNWSLKTGAIKTEGEVPALLDQILAEEKAKLERYQEKATRTPPSTNSTRGSAKKVAIDPNNLSSDERKYYDHYVKKGWKDVAENFLKESLGA